MNYLVTEYLISKGIAIYDMSQNPPRLVSMHEADMASMKRGKKPRLRRTDKFGKAEDRNTAGRAGLIAGGTAVGGLTGFEIGNMASMNRNIKRAGTQGRAAAVKRHGPFERLASNEKAARAYGKTLRSAEDTALKRLSRSSGLKGALIGAPLVGGAMAISSARHPERNKQQRRAMLAAI